MLLVLIKEVSDREDLFLSRMMRSHQFVGKLRSSTNMMEYCLYDQGDNPEDLDSDCEVDDELRQSIRAELAVIRYHNSKKVRFPITRSYCIALRLPDTFELLKVLCAQDGGGDSIDRRERLAVFGLASALARPNDGGARSRDHHGCTLLRCSS